MEFLPYSYFIAKYIKEADWAVPKATSKQLRNLRAPIFLNNLFGVSISNKKILIKSNYRVEPKKQDHISN